MSIEINPISPSEFYSYIKDEAAKEGLEVKKISDYTYEVDFPFPCLSFLPPLTKTLYIAGYPTQEKEPRIKYVFVSSESKKGELLWSRIRSRLNGQTLSQ